MGSGPEGYGQENDCYRRDCLALDLDDILAIAMQFSPVVGLINDFNGVGVGWRGAVAVCSSTVTVTEDMWLMIMSQERSGISVSFPSHTSSSLVCNVTCFACVSGNSA